MNVFSKISVILSATIFTFGVFVNSASGAIQDFGPAQAKAALNKEGVAKIDEKLLQRLLRDPTEGVLVEFIVPQNKDLVSLDRANRMIKDRSDFFNVKDRVSRTFLSADLVSLKDYDVLPMKFMKVSNRRALIQLLNNKDVKAVYANEVHKLSTASSLPFIQQPQAASLGLLGAGTFVVVMDSGVDYTREAFGFCTSPGVPSGCRVKDAIDIAAQDNVLDNTNTGFHGTNVAGIVAAVAPSASIISLDVETGNNNIYAADVVSAINWSIASKANKNIVAMNLSFASAQGFGSECSGSYATEPFARARAAGIVPVVATGNNGFSNSITSPACAPGAVRVGAVYDSNIGASSHYTLANCFDSTTEAFKLLCLSNNSSIVTLLAPGALVKAAGTEFSGTSQAAPHVSGAIAVLRGVGAAPNDTVDQVVARMIATGTNTTDSRNGLVKPVLNLLAAANSTKPVQPTLTVQWGYCLGQNDVRMASPGFVTSYEVYWTESLAFSYPSLVYSGSQGNVSIDVNTGYVRARSCSGSQCSSYSDAKSVRYYDPCL